MTLRLSRSYIKAGLFFCVGISVISLTFLISAARLKNSIMEIAYFDSKDINSSKKAHASNGLTDGPLIIIYNRIPKTGSTTFANIAYSLAARNRFSVIHVNVTHNSHILSLSDQLMFCQNVSTWTERHPAIFHGHFAHINFEQLGCLSKFQHIHPVYINIVRNPIERLVSYFYFLRHGDDFRPGLKRRKAGRNDTFDECVAAEGKDCEARLLWKQIPFFCGHFAECWEPGNPWALERAKANLASRYLAVGTLEQIRMFVRLVETLLPRYFSGAMRLLDSGSMGGDHLRRTTTKVAPTNATIEHFKRMAGHIWRMENDFYDFAQRNFLHTYAQVFGSQSSSSSASVTPLPSQFRFEKVRPKRLPVHSN